MLHTSDWHLGRSFHGAGLQRAHELYFDHLCEVVRAERIDAVLVSGDIYDRALPSPDSIALLDETLTRLLELGTKVVLSSGNHDSAVRLGFGSRAMERSGLFIRTGVGAIGRPIDLDIADDTTRITALPISSLQSLQSNLRRPSARTLPCCGPPSRAPTSPVVLQPNLLRLRSQW